MEKDLGRNGWQERQNSSAVVINVQENDTKGVDTEGRRNREKDIQRNKENERLDWEKKER